MKEILKDGPRIMLRFDKDEEVLAGLAEYAKNNQITAASFSAIGTSSLVELGYFNIFLKDYRKKPYMDNLEIVSLNGNIAMADGTPVIHAHGSFSNNEFGVLGGHVFKVVTLATCEVFLIKCEGAMERKNNPDFNLKLLV